MFAKDLEIAMGCYCVEDPMDKGVSMPYNVVMCAQCKTYQTLYLGDVRVIYNYSATAYGTIRGSMNDLFAQFISQNDKIQSIIEIGAGNGSLADTILEYKKDITYNIVDPTYSGREEGRTVQRVFIEDMENLDTISDTLVMSHVFEHFYRPSHVLEKLSKCAAIQHIYVSFPDLEYCIQGDSYHVLNPEHIYYVENDFIKALFAQYGFETQRTYHHKNHSVFFEFVRQKTAPTQLIPLCNARSETEVPAFFKRIFERVNAIQSRLEDIPKECKIYIWPCAMFSTFLFAMGLPKDRIVGVLDNSPHKIGKYLYGHNLQCMSFLNVLESNEPAAIILNGGCYNQEIDVDKYPHITFI